MRRVKTENSSSLAPLGERGDRKAEGAPRFVGRGGEGVSTKMNEGVKKCLNEQKDFTQRRRGRKENKGVVLCESLRLSVFA